jgi:ABC-type glutathione transport system ATPase component
LTVDPALAVEVIGLERSYRSGTGVFWPRAREIQALRGISFSIERGELFGLLGPNGAGKTTTIKVLTTLLLPSAGTARVLGFDVARQTREGAAPHRLRLRAATAACMTGCRRSTTSAISRTCTALRRARDEHASTSCWSSSG